jgi:hypothetical protein
MEIGRKTETWGSKFGFIMAAVGSSVGLGNFWRFPYTAGENGGGAFIVIYLISVAFVGLPLLMAEYADESPACRLSKASSRWPAPKARASIGALSAGSAR